MGRRFREIVDLVSMIVHEPSGLDHLMNIGNIFFLRINMGNNTMGINMGNSAKDWTCAKAWMCAKAWTTPHTI